MEVEIRLTNKAVMTIWPWEKETKEHFYKRLETLLDVCLEIEDTKHFQEKEESSEKHSFKSEGKK